MEKTASTEILIVGGGLVGLALALALNAQGRQVKLLDQSPALTVDPSDTRSLALSYSSVEFLKTLNEGHLWKALEPFATPLAKLHISEAGTTSLLRIQAKDYGEVAFGYVVPIARLYPALLAEVGAQKIELISSARVRAISGAEGLVGLETGEQLQASLILACDGGNSFIRESLQLKTEKYDYGQSALVTSVIFPQFHQNCGFERFLPDGVLALLPLQKPSAGFASGVVWVQSAAQTEAAMQRSDQELLAELQKVFGNRLGKFVSLGPRHTYPLQRILAKEIFSGRVLLMGNAAHQLNPVGAQGLNLGLRDIALLLKLLDKIPHPLSAVNLVERLFQPYEVQRKADQTHIEEMTHGIALLYQSQDLLSVVARRLAMRTFRVNPCAREKLVLSLMGKRTYLEIQEVSDAF